VKSFIALARGGKPLIYSGILILENVGTVPRYFYNIGDRFMLRNLKSIEQCILDTYAGKQLPLLFRHLWQLKTADHGQVTNHAFGYYYLHISLKYNGTAH
jgi:hypothetical protein